MEAAKEKGVKVINCPAHNAYAVAEYTIGMILNELRNITRSCTALKNGEWREKYQNSETLTELRRSESLDLERLVVSSLNV